MSLFDSARWHLSRQQGYDAEIDAVDVEWTLHPLNSSSNGNVASNDAPAAPQPGSNNGSLRGGWSGPRVSDVRNGLLRRGSFCEIPSASSAAAAVPQLVSPLTALHVSALIQVLHQPSVTLSQVVAHVNGVAVSTPSVTRGFELLPLRHRRLLLALELACANISQFGSLVGPLLNELPIACVAGQRIRTIGAGLFLIATAGSASYNHDACSLLVVGGQSFGMVLLSNSPIDRVSFMWQTPSGGFWERETNGAHDDEAIRACLDAHRPELHESLVANCRVIAFEAPAVNLVAADLAGVLVVTLTNGDQVVSNVEFWRGTTSQVALKKSAVTPHF